MSPRCADALGVQGAEDLARYGQSLGNVLIPAAVLFAFAIGWLIALVTQ